MGLPSDHERLAQVLLATPAAVVLSGYRPPLRAAPLRQITGETMPWPAPKTAGHPPDVRKAFLRARANSIEGGSTEVMKNILGDRVLGLPGEARSDKERPWRDVPRS